WGGRGVGGGRAVATMVLVGAGAAGAPRSVRASQPATRARAREAPDTSRANRVASSHGPGRMDRLIPRAECGESEGEHGAFPRAGPWFHPTRGRTPRPRPRR